jgi:hypothetical protein
VKERSNTGWDVGVIYKYNFWSVAMDAALLKAKMGASAST